MILLETINCSGCNNEIEVYGPSTIRIVALGAHSMRAAILMKGTAVLSCEYCGTVLKTKEITVACNGDIYPQ